MPACQVSRYSMYHEMMARTYRLKRRAEIQEETRQRIVDAAIELHETLGPSATTISEIAERAGVGRVTVYRHFPDEPALLRACSGQYFERHPLPDPLRWRRIADPDERLRVALRETFAYHRATEAMFAHVLADVRDDPVMTPYHQHWKSAVDVLAVGWSARGRRRTMLRAGIAVALSFDTWRTLVREQQLDPEQALDVALRLACDCEIGKREAKATTRQERSSDVREP
jgi:AcrR family transcriptional regulator